MKKKEKILMRNLIIISLLSVVNCAYAQYPYYGGYYPTPTYYPTSTYYPTTNYNSYGDMNQVFNQIMAITIQQVNAQQAQFEQLQNDMINMTVQQVEQQYRAEYNEFCKYNRKNDGSPYTYEEFMQLMAAAWAAEAENSSNSDRGSNYNNNEGSESYYESRYGNKDCHICRGTGVCQTCNGDGWQNNPFGLPDDPCANCLRENGRRTGKCSTCQGSGQVYGVKY